MVDLDAAFGQQFLDVAVGQAAAVSIEVDTAYLRGYADRLDANRDVALADMQDYVRDHCLHIRGRWMPAFEARAQMYDTVQ